MALHRLSEAKVKQAKPQSKPYKLSDGGGLYLLVNSEGSKYWRLKYRLGGKERVYAIGVYPGIGLAKAREKALEARELVREGLDPVSERKKRRLANASSDAETFQAIAEEWIATRESVWSPSYREAVHTGLSANLYPHIGTSAVRAITVPVLRQALKVMENRGALAALRKVRMWASQVFRFAIATGRADHDPANPLKGTFKAHKPKKFAAITKPKDFGRLVSKIRSYEGSPITKAALMLIAYTFTRTGELRLAEWSEFDFDAATWTIPADHMKMKEDHVVPLSRQAQEVLIKIREITGHSIYVFPNEHKPNKVMSNNTVLYALYRLGYHGRATGHGFRSSASTLLNELGYNSDVIERQLAHKEQNKIRAAYHRSEYLDERRKMMQGWADYIDGLANEHH